MSGKVQLNALSSRATLTRALLLLMSRSVKRFRAAYSCVRLRAFGKESGPSRALLLMCTDERAVLCFKLGGRFPFNVFCSRYSVPSRGRLSNLSGSSAEIAFAEMFLRFKLSDWIEMECSIVAVGSLQASQVAHFENSRG